MTKKKRRGLIVLLIIEAAVAVAVMVILFGFKTKNVICEGNTRLEDSQISEYIFQGKLPNAVIYKLFGNKNKHVPFVEKYDVSIAKPDTLKLTIHEREYYGYFKIENTNFYFDKTGTITDVSERQLEGVTPVEGAGFIPVREGENITLANEQFGKGLMTFANSFYEYKIPSDKITFDDKGDYVLKIKDVTVLCGPAEYTDEKMDRLSRLIPEMQDLKGVLHLEKFDGTEKNVYFNKSE